MRFATNIFPNVPMPDIVDWAREADEAGFEMIGVPDSPLLVRETYAVCAAILTATEQIAVAPLVTNPVTRHPSVAAGALMSLDELAPGRIRMAIGTGDSAANMIGRRPARLAEVEAYVAAVRGLLGGESVDWEGHEFASSWPNRDRPPDRNGIEIWMACHGPRSMRLAGRIADAAVSGFGLRPENIAFAREQVAAGAASAGRDPAEVDLWWHPAVTLAPSWHEESLVGLSVHFLFEHGLEGKQVPDELHEPLRTLHEEMGEWRGSDNFSPHLASRAQQLGVYDYLFEREGGFAGAPEDLRERVRGLEAAGARNLVLAPYGDGRRIMNRLADEVLPYFQDAR